jgi:hypothetical protein
MIRIITCTAILAIIALGAVSAFSQDEINRVEAFGGYAYMNLNRGIDPDEFNDDFSDFPGNRVNAHGFNGSLTYNFTRFIGAKFDLTLHSYGEDFTSQLTVNPPPPTLPPPGTFKISQNIYQYMGGIQIKDNKKEGSKLRPFAHALIGVSQETFSIDQTAPSNSQLFDVESTDWAMKFGGGIDYKIHKHFDLRLIQVDWNPIVRGDKDFGGRFGVVNGVLQNNIQLTFGIAIH